MGKVKPSMLHDHRSLLEPLCNGPPRAIYVMQAGPAVKIGIAVDPAYRRSQIQVGQPHPVRLTWWAWLAEADVKRAESEIHRQLRDTEAHANGEWYFIAPDTAISFIERTLMAANIEFFDGDALRMKPWEWKLKRQARHSAGAV